MKVEIVESSGMRFIDFSNAKQKCFKRLENKSVGFQFLTDKGVFIKVYAFRDSPLLPFGRYIMVHIDDFNKYSQMCDEIEKYWNDYFNTFNNS